MDIFADRLDSLSYLIRTPRESGHGLLQPVLCFLHGDDAGAPVPIRTALLGRGPLAPGASERAAEFLVIAPQLPHGGDTWNRYSATVREIILDVRARFGGDARRTYVTGVAIGGNGALDFARSQPDLWAAVWAVDPTRVPRRRLPQPTWVSMGAAARANAEAIIANLGLKPAGAHPKGDRLWHAEGGDPADAAARAYADDRAYAWLLAHRAAVPDMIASEPSATRPARRSAWYDAAKRAAGESQRRARRG
jgi:poly(3-hydroxybutyrate) depolymerase